MQKLLFAILILLFFAAGCSNDFEVGAPWKEIPVTYAILDGASDVQYIRVEKAFLGEESAFKLAKIADSLYYPADAITVFLDRMNGSTVVKSLQATRIDGRDEGITRDTGIFADQPNWLYKVVTAGQDSLIDGANYRVRIVRKDSKPDITGETAIPRTFRWADGFAGNLVNDIKIAFDTAGKCDINWFADSNGVYFDVYVTIRYQEFDINTSAFLGNKELVWLPAKNFERPETPSGGSGALNYKGRLETPSILEFLNKNVPVASDRYRRFDFLTVKLIGGGKEIKKFNETLSANSGITSAEIVRSYTNLSDGFGIVTAKNWLQTNTTDQFKKPRFYNEFIIDVVQKHPLTKNLGFRP